MQQLLNVLPKNFGIEMGRADNSRKLMHPIIWLRRKDAVPRAPAPIHEIDVPRRIRRLKNAAVGVAQPIAGIPILPCAGVGDQRHS
jgi:hypothetical protein